MNDRLVPALLPTESRTLYEAVLHHAVHSVGALPECLTPAEVLRSLALTIRDQMMQIRRDTEKRYRAAKSKRLYYLSMEFLIGRSLTNNLTNLGLRDQCDAALRRLGFEFADIEDCEVDAALGNGGLGRLAACFLDSLATMGLPGFGYGINYEYGMFKQEIRSGEQIEKPDNWRICLSPWTIERPEQAVLVPLYGRVEHGHDRTGNYNPMWLDWKVVVGVPHDLPIVGYGGRTVNVLRLFSARASQEVDMTIFNEGDYIAAVNQKVTSETISKVLYPSESVAAGRELRLVQEYFLVACAVRDMVRHYLCDHTTFDEFAECCAVQLNDTHPTLAIIELLRILIDENDVPWNRAWQIVTATFGYTNHTLMPEALERWPVSLLEHVLPRHLQLIFEVNHRFLAQVEAKWPGDTERVRRLSIIEEGGVKHARMANLAIVGSHAVNGVAAVHSELVRTELVPDFAELWPEKFQNKTNGVTPRRWLLAANRPLAELITRSIGDRWITELSQLSKLEPAADDAAFLQNLLAVKRQNKERLAAVIRNLTGTLVDPDSLFDVQVKRIHEYKRQLLNLLHVVHEYLRLTDEGIDPHPPRTFVFAGKAAPGYHAAKQIIRLIHDVAQTIRADKRVTGRLRVVFLPDYRVTLAERIIPAADLSEQISTAGTEASGTSNMKFAMNGALTVGTLDGANIEICEEVGCENIFIFGLTVPQVRALRADGPYVPRKYYDQSATIQRIVDAFRDSRFCASSPGRHDWVWQKLLAENERYLHLADLESYLAAHDTAAALFQDRSAWAKKTLLNIARIGKFSSDRTIAEYARDIWRIRPVV